MSVVQSYTFTVTQAEVLYVSQQVKRDLQTLRAAYPRLLDADRILDLHDAIATFLVNDAITAVGFSIEDPSQQNRVYHELRYSISYAGAGFRSGTGGQSVVPRAVPASSRLTPWVCFSHAMTSRSRSEQERIVAGTGWGLPGSSVFTGTYVDGSWSNRGSYSSGPLVAQAREYR